MKRLPLQPLSTKKQDEQDAAEKGCKRVAAARESSACPPERYNRASHEYHMRSLPGPHFYLLRSSYVTSSSSTTTTLPVSLVVKSSLSSWLLEVGGTSGKRSTADSGASRSVSSRSSSRRRKNQQPQQTTTNNQEAQPAATVYTHGAQRTLPRAGNSPRRC